MSGSFYQGHGYALMHKESTTLGIVENGTKGQELEGSQCYVCTRDDTGEVRQRY